MGKMICFDKKTQLANSAKIIHIKDLNCHHGITATWNGPVSYTVGNYEDYAVKFTINIYTEDKVTGNLFKKTVIFHRGCHFQRPFV